MDRPDLKKMADAADKFGQELTTFAAKMRDEIHLQFEDEDVANHVALNSMINMLAYGVTVIIAHQTDEELEKHLDRVFHKLHETVTELIGEKGPGATFLQIER